MFAILCFLFAEASRCLALEGGPFVNFWLPAGLYLAVLLLKPTRTWPRIALAAFPAICLFNWLQGMRIEAILGLYFAGTLQALLGAWLVRRFIAEKPSCTTMKELFGVVFFGGILAPTVSSIPSAATQVCGGMSCSFAHAWFVSWSIDAISIMILTPFILVWFSQSPLKMSPLRAKDITGLALTLLLLLLLIWLVLDNKGGILSPYKVLFIPALLYPSLRLGLRGATIAVLLADLAVDYHTVHCSEAQQASGDLIAVLYLNLLIVPLVGLIPAVVLAERDRTMANLVKSEGNYRGLVNSMRDIIYSVSTEGRVLFIAPQVQQYGFTVEELISRQFVEFILPQDRDAVQHRFQKTVTGHPGELLEFRMTARDGHVYWFQSISNPIHDDSGRIIGVSGMLRDVTRRKQAEEAQVRLATALEQAADAIVITDTLGTIQYVNRAFERITGYMRAEAIGQNPRLLKSGKQDAAFYRRMWDVLTGGGVWAGRLVNRRKDGSLFEEETTISPLRSNTGETINYVAVKRDVTREIQLEAQLRQAQKLEAVGQLAGGVAHDFNNILAATMMHLWLLQQNPSLDEDVRNALKELETEAKRSAGLTRQLLMFSRRSVLEMRQIDLNAVVTSLLKMLQRLLGEHIQLNFGPENSLPSIEADAGMMEQVLMNLAINARDAMPRGGCITLTTGVIVVDAEQVAENRSRRQGLFVCLAVSDTGCGMDAATMQRIFDPFFTTKEAGKGTGLGLATVHGIVAQHKGWVEVKSQVGQGTVFRVFLPACAALAKTEASVSALDPPKGHETILVVEDSESVRQMLVQSLSSFGYRVVSASNGQTAITVWQEHKSHINLLFTDMVMPEGVTGLELIHRLRAEKPGLKAIISSGYLAEITEPAKLAAHDIIYLPKPYDTANLGKTVRDCLDRMTQMSEARSASVPGRSNVAISSEKANGRMS